MSDIVPAFPSHWIANWNDLPVLKIPPAKLTDEMRQAADILEKVSRLYDWKDPARGEWSARQLRREADYLDRPVAM